MSCYFAECVYDVEEFFGGVFRVFRYKIIATLSIQPITLYMKETSILEWYNSGLEK
jgi:hypothetical protein